MSEITRAEAARDFDRLLDRAAAGERITITKDGVAVAELVPSASASRDEVERAIQRIRELRRGVTLGPDLSIADLLPERRE